MMNNATLSTRNFLGKYASYLILIAVMVNFAGVVLLGWSLFTVILGMGVDGFRFGLSYVMTPAIKGFIGFTAFLGFAILGQQRKTIATIFLFIIGVLTIIPIVLGGPEVLDAIIFMWGILPFVPHAIGGTLLIIAGGLTALWKPPQLSTGLDPIITSVEHAFTSPDGTQPHCPVCGHGLFGDEKFCPGCGRDLKLEEKNS